MKNYMQIAIEEANKGLEKGAGGPFGAVVAKDNRIIGKGHNCVLVSNDPTAHAEIVAIRDACNNIGSFNLEGAVLYTTCYPCPMCAGAILWSRIGRIVYCLNSEDAKEIGFDDSLFHSHIADKEFWKDMTTHDTTNLQDCQGLLEKWKNRENQNIWY